MDQQHEASDDERDTSLMVQSMERIDRLLNEQSDQINRLGARLEPISGPAETVGMEGGATELASVRRNSEHIETMGRLADRVDEHTVRISEMIRRLEV